VFADCFQKQQVLREHALTTPTLCPGWKRVPRCFTSTCPGNASCPSDILVPRYFGKEPFLFLVEPPCFLVALTADSNGSNY